MDPKPFFDLSESVLLDRDALDLSQQRTQLIPMASAAVGGVTPLIHSTMSTDMDVSEDLPPVTRAEALAAVERRTQNTPSKPSAAQVQQDREFRQKFRRLIDPGPSQPQTTVMT